MNADQVIALGNYCEVLLGDPFFNTVWDTFEQSTVGLMLTTKPEDKDAREAIYARLSGAREYLTFMRMFVEQRDALNAPNPDQDHLDNPAVHDIFREID